MNKELEQYLRFFIEYQQRDWPEWLAIVEFVVNNKDFSFYSKLWKRVKDGMGIRRKGKVEKSNGVCRKNEESTRGSECSIKESSGGYEKISR